MALMSDKTAGVKAHDRARFARSATRHRISKDRIAHVIANHRVRFEQPPPAGGEAARSTRIVYLSEDTLGSIASIGCRS